MELNKKELRKLLLDFNGISSRLMRVNYQDYRDVLQKFIRFIETQSVIYEFIKDCGQPTYDVEEEINRILKAPRTILDLGSTDKEEVSNIYSILKSISENQIDIIFRIADSYSDSNTYQDWINAFNNRVVFVLIGHIRKYLENIGIDMGMNENTKYLITVNNGQVNLATDQSTINATMNNGVDIPTLITLISKVRESLSEEFTSDEKIEINDSLEAVKEELSKYSPRKGLVKTTLRGLSTFTNKSVQFTAAVASIGSFIMQLPGFQI